MTNETNTMRACMLRKVLLYDSHMDGLLPLMRHRNATTTECVRRSIEFSGARQATDDLPLLQRCTDQHNSHAFQNDVDIKKVTMSTWQPGRNPAGRSWSSGKVRKQSFEGENAGSAHLLDVCSSRCTVILTNSLYAEEHRF